MRKAAAVLFVFSLGVFELSAQSVEVKSPNGGEQWALKSSQNITWKFAKAGSVKVDIVLRKGSGKVGIIKSQVALSAGSYTWTSVGTLEDGTPVGPGTSYFVRIRDVRNTFGDESDAAFSISGAPAPLVFKKIPPLERPPVNLFPPLLKVTDLSVDTKARSVHVGARNSGGPMTQNARIVLFEEANTGPRELMAKEWPKGQESVSFSMLLFSGFEAPSPCSCGEKWCSYDLNLVAELQGPDVHPETNIYYKRNVYYPARLDLAVTGFRWDPSGDLYFQVGNNGECTSSPWTYRLWVNGQLVETSPRHSAMKPWAWFEIRAKYTMPVNESGIHTFRVEVASECPALEANKDNNTIQLSATPHSK